MMSDKFFHQQYTTAPLDGGGGGSGGYSAATGPAANQYQAPYQQTNQPKEKPESKANGSKSYDHRRGPAKKQGGH